MGAMVGAALGHAAENGGFGQFNFNIAGFGGPRIAAPPRQRDQVFALGVVVLAAKLAKCDGPVNRAEIAAFKRHFRIPEESVRDVGKLFDEARDSADGYLPYATRMGNAFADSPFVLEEVLTALFGIARADAPVTKAEDAFLRQVWAAFGLGGTMKGVVIIQSAMPVAVFNYLFARMYDAAPEEVAGLVLLSTLLSYVTLPVIVALVL